MGSQSYYRLLIGAALAGIALSGSGTAAAKPRADARTPHRCG